MGLTAVDGRGALRAPASTSSRRATTSGTSARSTRASRPTSGSCGRSTTAPTASPAAAGASTTPPTARSVAVLNLQGRTYMKPIENPFTDADRLLDEGVEALPPVRLVDFHCEITSREERHRALPRRAGQRGRRHAHPRRRPATSGSCPSGTAYQSDLGMTGPLCSVIGFDPAHRAAALPQRPPDPLRGRRAGRSSSTRPRSTSTRRPGVPSRSSGSGGSSRSDAAATAARTRPSASRWSRRRPRRSTSTPTPAAPTGCWSRSSSSAAGRGGRRPAPRDHRPRHAGRRTASSSRAGGRPGRAST